MGDVFANGLEVSGKAVSAKTIAAFPDVCFTPPENPATPPGVPVPYPNFAMAGETEEGSGTVMVKGESINLKNKSDISKTTGDEAGAAAKKGLITSQNTGKAYFRMWSPDVKAEGEPVTRMTDLTTDNHGSPLSNTPPFPHIAKLKLTQAKCAALLLKYDLLPVPYDELECPEGYQKEHTVENQFFACRGLRSEPGLTKAEKICKHWQSYTDEGGRCICMHTTYPDGTKSAASSPTREYSMTGESAKRSHKGSDHLIKSKMCADTLKHTPCQSLDSFTDSCVDATLMTHEKTQHLATDDPEREKLGACLKEENLREIKKQLDDKKGAEKKKQGQMQCAGGAGGGCDHRDDAGKPAAAISDSAAGRHADAVTAGRC